MRNTVESINETHVEDKLCTFTIEYTHFILSQCPIYTHEGASAKFSINLQEIDYSAVLAILGHLRYKFVKHAMRWASSFPGCIGSFRKEEPRLSQSAESEHHGGSIRAEA